MVPTELIKDKTDTGITVVTPEAIDGDIRSAKTGVLTQKLPKQTNQYSMISAPHSIIFRDLIKISGFDSDSPINTPTKKEDIKDRNESDGSLSVVRTNIINAGDVLTNTNVIGCSRAVSTEVVCEDNLNDSKSNENPGLVCIPASKIPVPNIRQAKCASWSGSDMMAVLSLVGTSSYSVATTIQESESTSNNEKSWENCTKGTANDVRCANVNQNPTMPDLTPGL